MLKEVNKHKIKIELLEDNSLKLTCLLTNGQ